MNQQGGLMKFIIIAVGRNKILIHSMNLQENLFDQPINDHPCQEKKEIIHLGITSSILK